MIKRPLAISDKPVIRVVFPCGTLKKEQRSLELGLERLEKAGCEVRWDPTRVESEWREYLAGEDEIRAAEFASALREPGVEIVWFARGGSGGSRILRPIVEAAKQTEPRVVIGFSDATSILNALHDHAGWLTFHGPVVTALGRPKVFRFELEQAFSLLQGQSEGVKFRRNSEGGFGRGTLRGGNLTVLASTVGLPYGPQPTDESIWFLEDVNEPPYRLDRAFHQLRASGVLNGCSSVWIGDLSLPSCQKRVAMEMFETDSRPLRVFQGAPAGHRGPLTLLPIGGEVLFDPAGGQLMAQTPWVEVGRA